MYIHPHKISKNILYTFFFFINSDNDILKNKYKNALNQGNSTHQESVMVGCKSNQLSALIQQLSYRKKK